jgi:hypothetical protein
MSADIFVCIDSKAFAWAGVGFCPCLGHHIFHHAVNLGDDAVEQLVGLRYLEELLD